MSFLSGLIGGLGSIVGGLFNKDEADKNRAFQLAAAKNSIQWRVQDAQKAGVHPLYALGAPTFSPSPVMSGLGDSIANAGQDISRAVEATADNPERFAAAASRQLTSLQLSVAVWRMSCCALRSRKKRFRVIRPLLRAALRCCRGKVIRVGFLWTLM